MLPLNLFCASVDEMHPKVSEKPKRVYKGVTLSIKLYVIKWLWYDLVGYFGVWELSKIFPIN